MLAALYIAFAAFAPVQQAVHSLEAQRSAAPAMSETMSTRRAAIFKLAAIAVPVIAAPTAANAVSAVPIWKTSKKSLGSKSGPPKGSGADKCKVSKPCTTGAGIKWDPDALGVKKGATLPGGANPTSFLKTKTYENSPY